MAGPAVQLPRLAQTEPLWVRVHRTLENSIIRHLFPPGAPLVEEGLAQQLGVSRIPVREALRMLERDGWVTIRPYAGATVRVLTRDEADELFRVRALFEGYAAGRAASRATDRGIARLLKVVDQERAAFERQDRDAIVELNARFHDEVYRLSGNKTLGHLSARISKQISWLVTAYAGSGVAPRLDEHLALVDALRDSDARRAQRVAKQHVDNARKAYRQGVPRDRQADSGGRGPGP
jgi:DNA-binding GntR family transcriptional regulator